MSEAPVGDEGSLSLARSSSVCRVAELLRIQREAETVVLDVVRAARYLDVSDGDEDLAARWIALGLQIEDVERCAGVGLQPEQLTRVVTMDGEDVRVASLVRDVGDEDLLRLIAVSGVPDAHPHGGWVASDLGWWCSTCGVFVPRDPRDQ